MKNTEPVFWAQYYCSEAEYKACHSSEWAKGDPMPRGLKPIVVLNAARPTRAIVRRRVTATPRRSRGASKGASSRASEKSGDGNSDGSDPDPARLLDQSALAQFLCISKKTLQNQYSVAPHTLPAAIQIPGARGPRWTPQSVQAWLEQRPQHTPKPAQAPKRKVGRPRIALVARNGGAA